ncbi:Fpg/Nei family DNA glycosylase [Streptomyces xiaopingdaonensis]|uniref:Fpg/Nei family DNA glycosylase n=1 Tax=Streptomyces xiaopingdaonensis TaxID=1565415 RepID=UPI0002FB8BBF|nr:DNA-formamidopyrimidine glycosylase family protein [Streptomyces xiaopingdaonensis]
MPELPDVEADRTVLRDCATHRTIDRVDVHDAGVVHGVTLQELSGRLVGRRFTRAERRGKWLLAHTGGPTLLLHFGMTGELRCCSPEEELHPHDRVVFALGRHRELRFRDQRKLKGMWLYDEPDSAPELRDQGPDALKVSRGDFVAALAGRRGGLKSALMDQSVVAGLGNLLADEVLWRARLAPGRPTAELDEDALADLRTTMRRTLSESLPTGRVPAAEGWLTGRRGDSDATCPRCGTRLREGRVAGRTTVWCPHCQPE